MELPEAEALPARALGLNRNEGSKAMSRSGYNDYSDDTLQLGRWRAQVASATRGKRGQAFLRDLLAALDAMPEKRLVKQEFETDGEVCTLGCIARQRKVDMSTFDPEDDDVGEAIGPALGIAHQLAREIMWENDQFYIWDSSRGRIRDDPTEPERRWKYMRDWVAQHIVVTPEEAGAVEVTTPGE
jgi:hypothetical protein